jgi:hypothetical protein
MFYLPNRSHRLTLMGKTGSGKTQAALWHLSHCNFDVERWIVLDFKGEEKLARINNAQDIDLGKIPKKPGLYRVRPRMDQEKELEKFFWDVWRETRIGVFVDEAYMIEDSKAFDTLLTQGRTLLIPMIVCTQRPVWITRFAFSEADFLQAFRLNDLDDWRGRVLKFMPGIPTATPNPPAFHSWYYDTMREDLVLMKPVPDFEVILSTLENKLARRKRSWI